MGTPGIFEEYYSIGHRNPHRLTMDPVTGEMYIGEIGSNVFEEINVLQAGQNYGWPVFEGDRVKNTCTSQLYNNMTQ
ncbi:MAG: PQQ-dependent sugar dehydrogenase, partial [Bacteroidota bacterium]